jgi:hypothetical protein
LFLCRREGTAKVIDETTVIAVLALAAAGYLGLRFVTKERVRTQAQLVRVRMRVLPYGDIVSELETAARLEEERLEKAYASAPLRWALTGSWYTNLSPFTLGFISFFIDWFLIILCPTFFEGFISGAPMIQADFVLWAVLMCAFPALTLARTVQHVIGWFLLRRKYGVKQ